MNLLLFLPQRRHAISSRLLILLFLGLLFGLNAVLLAFFPPPEGPGTGEQPRTGTITAKVTLPDGSPDQTKVRLWQYTRGSLDTMVPTNAKGELKITQLPYGRYWIIIRGETVGDVEITAKQPTVNLKISAPAYVTLRGKVRARATHFAVPGALIMTNMRTQSPLGWKYPFQGNEYEWAQYTVPELVKFATQEGIPFTVADANGQFEIKLPPHATLFAIDPAGKLFPARWTHQAAPGKVLLQTIDLEPKSLHLIKGRITLPGGQPYANGPAKFFLRRNMDVIHDITTDAQGHYEFLPKDSVYDTQWLEVPGFAGMHQHAPLDKGPPFAPIDWPLKTGQKGTLVASVLQADGKTPFPDGFKVNYIRDSLVGWEVPNKIGGKPVVYYYAECGGAGSGALTVENGLVRGAIDVGFFRLSATPLPLTIPANAPDDPSWSGTRINDWSVNGYDAIFGSNFTIDVDKTTTVKFVQPQLSAAIITVKGPGGKRLPGVHVHGRRWLPRTQSYSAAYGVLTTDKNGQVFFDPLPAGEYIFYPVFSPNNQDHLLPRLAVTLEQGKPHQLEIVLPEAKEKALAGEKVYEGKVSGQVFLPDGKTPAAHAALYFTRNASEEIRVSSPSTYASVAGTFTMSNLPEGKGLIHAWGDESALTSLAVELGKATKPVRLTLEPACALSGVVKSTDGTNLDNVTVAVLPVPRNTLTSIPDYEWSFKFFGEGQVGYPIRSDGTFHLHGLKPGKQFLCVYRDGLLQQDSVVALDLKPGEHRKEVTLTLEAGTKLQVTFRASGKNPLPADLRAHLYSDHGSLFSCGGMLLKDNVALSKRALPPGKYHIWLEVPYYHEKTEATTVGIIHRNVIVKPGGDLQKVEVDLPKPALLKGKVELQKGNAPLGGLRVCVHYSEADGVTFGYPPNGLVKDATQAGSYAWSRTAPDGSFTLFGLAPGTYRLSIHREHSTEPSLLVTEPVQVLEGQVTQMKPVQVKGL